MLKSDNINFRTVIKPTKFDFNISYKSKMVFIGSCFTENIGRKLKQFKFNIDINPFGILYNPVSVKNSLDILTVNKMFDEKDVFFHNEQWHSYFHHSRFSDSDKKEMLNNVNKKIGESFNYLKQSNFLFITFGTAWIYEHVDYGIVVSNCHKVPSKRFKRRLLDADEIVELYQDLLKRLKVFNPDMKIIFTISPVRHLRDGLVQNNLSKSILRVAVEKLVNTTANSYYFPAYEIMNDDLRDYRFYDTDMVHPNETAQVYIFNCFKQSFFSDETENIYKEVQQIIKAKQHKAFNEYSDEHQKFIKKTIDFINMLKNKYEFINFSDELLSFEKKQ